jgi:hypothetical protein
MAQHVFLFSGSRTPPAAALPLLMALGQPGYDLPE